MGDPPVPANRKTAAAADDDDEDVDEKDSGMTLNTYPEPGEPFDQGSTELSKSNDYHNTCLYVKIGNYGKNREALAFICYPAQR